VSSWDKFWLPLAFGLDGREVAAEYLKKWFGGKNPRPSSAKLCEF